MYSTIKSKSNDINKRLITCILLVPLVCSCGKQATTSVDTREPLLLNDSLQEIITLDTVRDTPLTNELLLNGRVSFNPERVAHVYPIFGGNVTSVHAEVGDYVGKGDVLAVIRSGEIADIDKQRKEAEHQLAIANRNLEATQDMARSGMASDRDFLQAQQEQADADAETKRIQEMYSIYNITAPSTYVVKAPVSGFIIDKNINRDMQIRSDQGEEMFTISGLDDVWVMADVYEGDISKVKEGATVRITTLAYKDMEFTGTIDKVYHMIDQESKTMSARVKLRNEKYMLKPGMFTNVYVQSAVKGESMPCVNAHAVIFEDGKVSQTGRPNDGTDATGFYNLEFHVDIYPEKERESERSKAVLIEKMQEDLAIYLGLINHEFQLLDLRRYRLYRPLRYLYTEWRDHDIGHQE